MSLTDQERIEMSADNCEVLRARLAKYEDAEGNPISTIAKQAREIERLRLNIAEYNEHERCYQSEIERLKAQPSGVVLPEYDETRTSHNVDEAYQNGWNACLDEVARLNSSPVSDGDDRKLSDIGNELHNLSCHVVHHNEGWANQLGTLASELWNWQARAALTASAGQEVNRDNQ